MLKNIEGIVFYLSFAKSKLDTKCLEHQKAKEEINTLIKELEEYKPRTNRGKKDGNDWISEIKENLTKGKQMRI